VAIHRQIVCPRVGWTPNALHARFVKTIKKRGGKKQLNNIHKWKRFCCRNTCVCVCEKNRQYGDSRTPKTRAVITESSFRGGRYVLDELLRFYNRVRSTETIDSCNIILQRGRRNSIGNHMNTKTIWFARIYVLIKTSILVFRTGLFFAVRQ